MPTFSHPLTVRPASVPDTLSNESVLALPAPPVREPMSAMPVSLKVRFPESSASLMSPMIRAPLSTTTLSQPVRPRDRTPAFRLPDPPRKVSVSPAPAPPSISVTLVKDPPANVSLSAPPPRMIFPAISAPVFTVTSASPAPARITLPAPAAMDAPLPSRMSTSVAEESSVLIAAAFAPLLPVTVPDTAMEMPPLPS